MQRIVKTRGVKGTASLCALAAIGYLFTRNVLTVLVSLLLGLVVPGASLSDPVGVSVLVLNLLQLLVGIAAIALPVAWLLHTTRLEANDLRLTIPPQWSPLFCLVVFLGVANGANIVGGLLGRLFATPASATVLPSGGAELLMQFLLLCLVPAISEEVLFRGALQGLMRPCGSAVAVFAPALLFGLLHLDLAQGLTAFTCAIFLGWLAERTGSILPGMALHLVNNTLAFINIYLQSYAPSIVATVFELFLLLFFPVCAAAMIYRARRQGFHFSAGLRPGVDPLTVFTSPAYGLTVIFLVVYAVYLTSMG